MNRQTLHALLRRHPFPARIAVAALISLAVASLLAVLGMRSLLVSGVAALVAVPAAFVVLWTREERQQAAQLVAAAAQIARSHWRSVVGAVLWVWLTALLLWARKEPTQPEVRLVATFVHSFGAIAALAVPAFAWALGGLTGSPRSSAVAVSQALRGLAFYALALWLLGEVGDAVYARAHAEPHVFAVGTASLAIIWLIINRAMRPAYDPRVLAWSEGRQQAQAKPPVPRELSARDLEHTSVHEAGHALVYAALGDIPRNADVRAMVRTSPTAAGVLGSVTPVDSGHFFDEPPFIEWRMLTMLAGKRAELVVHGWATLGSISDHEGWLQSARAYLGNHNRGIYYVAPANELEQLRNEAQLEALKAEQEATLDAFFALNADVLRDLANALLLAGVMDRAALMPFLARVKLPPKFPRPFGAFETFGEDPRAAADGASTPAGAPATPGAPS